MKKLLLSLMTLVSVTVASQANAGGRCLFYQSAKCGTTPAGFVWDDLYSTNQSPNTCKLRAQATRDQCFGANNDYWVTGYYNKSGDGVEFTAAFVAQRRSGVKYTDIYVRGHNNQDHFITTINY
jgi:hypothetical protein